MPRSTANNTAVAATTDTACKTYHCMIRFAKNLIEQYNAQVFGGFVRDLLVDNVDPTANSPVLPTTPTAPKDLDVYFAQDDLSDEDIIRYCRSLGMEAHKCPKSRRDQELFSSTSDDLVYIQCRTFELTVMYSSILTGKPVKIRMDVVASSELTNPPFGRLDFLCNGFVWNHHGIEFSASSGTAHDNLTPTGRKIFEAEVIQDMRENRTKVLLPVRGFGANDSFMRKVFVERLIKMWDRGWTFTNLDSLQLVPGSTEELCSGCSRRVSAHSDKPYLQAKCCSSVVFGLECFREFAEQALENGTRKLNCPKSGSVKHPLLVFPSKFK